MATIGLRHSVRDLPVSNRRPTAHTGELAVFDFVRSMGYQPAYESRQYRLRHGVWVPDIWVPALRLNIEVTRADHHARSVIPAVRIRAANKLAQKLRNAAYVDQHYGTISFVVMDSDLKVLEFKPELFLPELADLLANGQLKVPA